MRIPRVGEKYHYKSLNYYFVITEVVSETDFRVKFCRAEGSYPDQEGHTQRMTGLPIESYGPLVKNAKRTIIIC